MSTSIYKVKGGTPMTTTTRPMNPTYLTILRQVAELGEATCRSIVDVPAVSTTMSNLAQMGWLLTTGNTVIRAEGKPGSRVRVYRLTAAGRAALESGEVPDGMVSRFTTTNFNGKRVHTKPPKPAEVCRHYWLIGAPPLQHHECRNCGATKDQPFTFGGELVRVGGGRVTKSERFG